MAVASAHPKPDRLAGPESPALTAPHSQRRGPVQWPEWSVSRPHCSGHQANRAWIIANLKSRVFHSAFFGKTMCDAGHIAVVSGWLKTRIVCTEPYAAPGIGQTKQGGGATR
jgi:hypothetical protein